MKINVISFNIRCCDDPNGYSVAERAPRLKSIISGYNPDVICFQEFREIWEPHLVDFYSDEYEIFIKYRNKTVDVEAAAILWRKDKFECIKKGYFWLSDTPEVESRGWDKLFNCYRICVYAVLKSKATGEIFNVMNTHFGFGDKGQIDSAKLIYEYSRKVSDYKTFVVGDFNMTPESKGYATMVENFTDLNVLTSNDSGTTYHGYNPEKINDEHIDYCFIDKTIIPINQTIIRDTVEGKYPSDHFGILAELNI